jgi:hypothetical protein
MNVQTARRIAGVLRQLVAEAAAHPENLGPALRHMAAMGLLSAAARLAPCASRAIAVDGETGHPAAQVVLVTVEELPGAMLAVEFGRKSFDVLRDDADLRNLYEVLPDAVDPHDPHAAERRQ